MPEATYTVSLHDLDEGPQELKGSLTEDWVNNLLEDTELSCAEAPEGSPSELELTVTKLGVQILVQGQLRLSVSVPCARTLDPAIYHLHTKIFLTLSPARGFQPKGRGRSARRRNSNGDKKGEKKGGWENDDELSEEDAGQDTYDGEEIGLDLFLREFILLEIPMIPLREDLRGAPIEATPPLPEAGSQGGSMGESDEELIDPRLSPLKELKARLEKKD